MVKVRKGHSVKRLFWEAERNFKTVSVGLYNIFKPFLSLLGKKKKKSR